MRSLISALTLAALFAFAPEAWSFSVSGPVTIDVGTSRVTGGATNRLLRNDGTNVQDSIVTDDGSAIGVNEGTPLAEFHLTNDQAALTELRIDNSNASGSMGLKLFDGSNQRAQFEYDTAGALLTIGTNIASGQVAIDSAAGTEAVRIDSSGNFTLQTGQLLVPNGSAGSPSLSFTDEPGTGIRRSGAAIIGISLGGASRYNVRAGIIEPSTDGAADLGKAGNRWGSVFADTQLGIHDGVSDFITSLTTSGLELATGTNITFADAQTYSESNVSTDRTYDANSTTLDEVADVLGTLIVDLRAAGLVN